MDDGGADEINFDAILILYCAQYLIFLVMRPILYTLWSFMMCCCDRGMEYEKEDQFDWSIISFEYIEF